MSINLNRILHDLREKQAREDSLGLPTPATHREASASEKAQPYMPANYGLLFCPHGKSYFDVCQQCRRSRKIAREHFLAFEKRHGLA